MASDDDKAKRLKEIQQRLAEIQAKTTGTAKASAPKPSSPKVEENKVEVPKNEVESIPKNEVIEKTKPESIKEPVDEIKKAADVPKKNEQPITAEKKVPSEVIDSKADWKHNQVKKEEIPKNEKAKLNKEEKPKKVVKTKGNKLSKIYTLVSLVITVFVIGYFLYSYFLEDKMVDPEELSAEIPKDAAELNNTAESENLSETQESELESNELAEKVKESDSKKSEVMQSREQPNRIVEEPVKKKSSEVVPSTPSSSKVPKGFIISYASNSSEDMAKSNVKKLSQSGFNASYYYMPNHQKSSPALYKVYIGPFGSESEALPTFKKVVAMNDKAFILRMN